MILKPPLMPNTMKTLLFVITKLVPLGQNMNITLMPIT